VIDAGDQTPSNQGSAMPRVLIVDDEPRVLRSLEAALKSRFEISTARDAIQAQEILQGFEPIDVIVSDERMPKCPGHVFLKWAKDSHPHSTRILLTGMDNNTLLESIASADVYKCLPKPWNIQEFRQILDQAVLRSRALVNQSAKAKRSGTSRLCAMVVLDKGETYLDSYKLVGEELDGILATYFLDTPDDVISTILQNEGIGVLLIDLSIGDTDAAKLISVINNKRPSVSIIVTATPASAGHFMKNFGNSLNFQYITKPMSIKRIQPLILSAVEQYFSLHN